MAAEIAILRSLLRRARCCTTPLVCALFSGLLNYGASGAFRMILPERGEAENGQGRLILRNPEKGAFVRGALRKLVADCAPNLRKSAGISFRTSEEGCAKLSQIYREFESRFRTILCKYPFSNARFLKFLRYIHFSCKPSWQGRESGLWCNN